MKYVVLLFSVVVMLTSCTKKKAEAIIVEKTNFKEVTVINELVFAITENFEVKGVLYTSCLTLKVIRVELEQIKPSTFPKTV